MSYHSQIKMSREMPWFTVYILHPAQLKTYEIRLLIQKYTYEDTGVWGTKNSRKKSCTKRVLYMLGYKRLNTSTTFNAGKYDRLYSIGCFNTIVSFGVIIGMGDR